MKFANGYTMVLRFNLDDQLGWIYISIALSWTIILLAGIAFLISRRHLPFLRIRNVPLAVSAVAILHVYWVLCMCAYVLQGFFPCATEYWIMSVYLPLGIELFQACNTQLLHIADIQKRYAQGVGYGEKELESKKAAKWKRYLAYASAGSRVKRTMALIAYGMCVQVIVAVVVFLVSRKFHAGFGVVGSNRLSCGALKEIYEFNDFVMHLSEDERCGAVRKIACRRGWEWTPSIIWQFFWSWFYAPYLLWQVRDIKDVHGWRKQTTYCCLAGLFATPLWLCALYIPDMLRVNHYYVPPLWFAPSIFLIEAFLVFVPCWQIIKNYRLQSKHLDIIAEWESKNNGSSIADEAYESGSKTSRKAPTTATTKSRRGEMYTMTALESAVRTNPQPLLIFAALKDFSGENISFLTKVLDWKRAWSPSSPTKSGFLRRPSVHEINNQGLRRQQFKRAVDIYASYVSLKYSDYPINLSHVHLKELEAIFEGAAMLLYAHAPSDLDSNSATPFDNFSLRIWPSHKTSHEDIEAARSRAEPSKHDAEGISMLSHKTQHTSATDHSTDLILQTTEYDTSKRATVLQTYEMSNTATEQLPEYVPIPPSFGPDAFDRAEEHIKYVVLTNTWPKFVNAGYARQEESAAAGRPKGLLAGVRRGLTRRRGS